MVFRLLTYRGDALQKLQKCAGHKNNGNYMLSDTSMIIIKYSPLQRRTVFPLEEFIVRLKMMSAEMSTVLAASHLRGI